MKGSEFGGSRCRPYKIFTQGFENDLLQTDLVNDENNEKVKKKKKLFLSNRGPRSKRYSWCLSGRQEENSIHKMSPVGRGLDWESSRLRALLARGSLILALHDGFLQAHSHLNDLFFLAKHGGTVTILFDTRILSVGKRRL